MSSRRLLAPTCAALALAAALPTSAGAVGASARYQVSIQGEVKETWNYSENSDGYACEPRHEGNGTATARFASPGSHKLRFHTEHGIRGRVPVNVTVQRNGARRSFYRDPECGRNDRVSDNSGCGTVAYRARAGGFGIQGRSFGFGIAGDRDRWNGKCPVAEDPLPKYDLDPLAMLHPEYGPRLRTRKLIDKLLHPRRKRWVLRHTKRVVLPYTRSEFGGTQSGQYVADIAWTVTFRRVSRVKF